MSGYFVGRSDDLGASVDLSGFDGTSQAVARALDPAAPSGGGAVRVGIGSLVNLGDRPIPVPPFRAVLADGTTVPLTPASRALAGRRSPAAVRARAKVPRAVTVAPGGAATVYLVLRGVRVADITELRMAQDPAQPTRLAPEPR